MVYSDSKYIIDSVDKKWVFNWVRSNFKGKKNKEKPIANLKKKKLMRISLIMKIEKRNN